MFHRKHAFVHIAYKRLAENEFLSLPRNKNGSMIHFIALSHLPVWLQLPLVALDALVHC